MSTFPFKVTFAAPKMTLSFTEVSGLDHETQLTALPAKPSALQVVLKGGKALCTKEVIAFFTKLASKTLAPTTVTIQHVDTKGNVINQWVLNNAQVTKAVSAGVKTIGQEVTITELTLAPAGAGNDARKGGGSHW